MAELAGEPSSHLVKPRKLAMDAQSVDLRLLPDRPQAIPGASGALILEARDVTAEYVHLMLYLSGRGPKDGEFVFNESRARKGQQLALCLCRKELMELAGLGSGAT